MLKSITVVIPNTIKMMDKLVAKDIKTGVEDITDDLHRVATLRTPVDSTTLEKSGDKKVISNSRMIEGQVSFTARSKRGFNYAKVMNDKKYSLGKKSQAKSGRGIRSKFYSGALPVGTGYLTDTAKKCEAGYSKHINSSVKSGLVKLQILN